MGKQQDGSLLFLYPAFWIAKMDLLLYSGPALWLNTCKRYQDYKSFIEGIYDKWLFFFYRFPFGAHQSYESYCQPQQPLQTSHSPKTESRSAHSQSPVQYTDLTNYSQGHKKQQQQSTVSHHSDEESSGRQRQYPRYQSSPEQERVCLLGICTLLE